VTEVNGQKQETPQSRYFASGPRFERSTLKITISSFVDGTNVSDVLPCSLVDMECGLKVEEYLYCDNGGRVSSKYCKPPNKMHYVVSYGNNTFKKMELVSKHRGADKSLAQRGTKQATATEDFEFHISYL
jgi:hypothetical protein